MIYEDIRIGQLVTWGSGRPRGRVVEVDPRWYGKEPVCVELVETQTGTCGMSFKPGTRGWFSPLDLTLINGSDR